MAAKIPSPGLVQGRPLRRKSVKNRSLLVLTAHKQEANRSQSQHAKPIRDGESASSSEQGVVQAFRFMSPQSGTTQPLGNPQEGTSQPLQRRNHTVSQGNGCKAASGKIRL